MAVNEVIVNGEQIINLKNDTVTPATLAEGVTAHDAAGNEIVGTMAAGTDIIIDDYPKENSPNAISSGGVYLYLNLFSNEIKKLQDRVAALEAKIGDLSFAKSNTIPSADTDENVVTFVKQ